jgi:hypothetical protein
MIATERRIVTIPGCMNHAGHHAIQVTVDWVCPECGAPRGEPYKALSYDGSRRLGVDSWRNPCGHIDGYPSVREEAGVASCSPNRWPHG